MWTVLGLVVLVTAVRGVRRTRAREHPYAHTARLTGPEDVVPTPLGST
jgi:hypothetical protein